MSFNLYIFKVNILFFWQLVMAFSGNRQNVQYIYVYIPMACDVCFQWGLGAN